MVIERAYTNRPQTYWKCECDCGNKEFITQAAALVSGKSQRCMNCKYLDKRKHLHTDKRIFNTWQHMISRCFVEKTKAYKHYGGRGITVCKEWRTSVKNFEDWALQNGYADNLSIDRIDVNGNYEPSNCRWATNKEQANNKRKSKYIVYDGRKQTVTEWAREYGMPEATIRYRMKKGVTEPDILFNKNRLPSLEKYIN